MGTTLQHGIFLPAEGERNCYAGLASNWTILDGVVGGYSSHAANTTIHVTAADKEAWNGKADASALTAHTGNTTIHVTAADKEAWNGKADTTALTAHTGNTTIHVTAADKTKWDAVTGKADASALTAHTGNTTIHVTAADKQTWDAVTSKANDTDAVHKSGAETIAGEKTFSDNTFFNSVRATSSAATGGQGSTILPLFSILTFANGDPSVIARLDFRASGTDGSKSLYPHENNQYTLGLTSRRFSNVFSYNINSNNPGALSMPDLSAGVDISGYFTTGTTENTYTPTVNGWVCIRGMSSGTSGIFVENSNGFYASANSIVAYTGTDRYVNLCFPVIGGESYNIVLKSVNTSIAAKFFPCQGNV